MKITLEIPEAEFNRYQQYYRPWMADSSSTEKETCQCPKWVFGRPCHLDEKFTCLNVACQIVGKRADRHMMATIDLKLKIRDMFLSYPQQVREVYPEGPLKMVDDAMGRCFRFYDKNNKEFLSISIVEKQFLPKEIGRYFNMTTSERQATAAEEISKCINNSSMLPEEMVATDIIESLRLWVKNKE